MIECKSDTVFNALVEIAETFKCQSVPRVVKPDDLIPVGEIIDGYYADPLVLLILEIQNHMTGKVDWL